MEDVLKRNNVNIFGKGDQPILFVHGFGCDQHVWKQMTPAFEDRYKIILMDLVGAGQSDLSAYIPQKYSSLRGYADDVIEIFENLDLKDVIFVGHSVSAMIGALIDIKAPGMISHLIMLGPSPCYINQNGYIGGFDRDNIDELLSTMESNYLGWSKSIAPSIMGNEDRPELGTELADNFCRTDPEIGKHFARVTFLSDNRDDLAKVQVKTLVLQCKKDIIAPESVGEFVHHKIDNSEFKLIDASGHCPHMSAPEETIHAIEAFLST